MHHALLGGHIVELEDVLDHLLLIGFDLALFLADIHHHADLLLGDALAQRGDRHAEGLEEQRRQPLGKKQEGLEN